MGTHYDVLGLPPTATATEITDRYRELAKLVHPDTGGDAITFAVLDESYDVLSNPERRAEYDRGLERQRAADATPGHPAGATRAGASGYRSSTPPHRSTWLRDSTPAERARARADGERGIQSWHQTPGEYVKTGAKNVGLAVVVGVVLAIARSIFRA